MPAQHEVWAAQPNGTRIKLIEEIEEAQFSLVVNGLGSFSLKASAKYRDYLQPFNRLVYYRRPTGGRMQRVFSGQILLTEDSAPDDAISFFCGGYDWNWLLGGRNVFYYANTDTYSNANSQFTTDPADDAMKSIVRYNLGSSATTGNGRLRTASISSTYFSVAADESLGPSVSKGFAYRNVLDILKGIADDARNAGTEIYFDVVDKDGTMLEFRTFKGQRGVDRTRAAGGGLVFSFEAGAIKNPKRRDDYRQYASSVGALGQGQGNGRNVQFASDTALASLSPFADREAEVSAAHIAPTVNENALVSAEAQRGLVNKRPIKTFTASLISRPGSEYGLDWSIGDRLTASFLGVSYEVMVRTVNIRINKDGERIDTYLEADL